MPICFQFTHRFSFFQIKNVHIVCASSSTSSVAWIQHCPRLQISFPTARPEKATREGRQSVRMAARSQDTDIAAQLHAWTSREMHFHPQGAFQGASMPTPDDLRKYANKLTQGKMMMTDTCSCSAPRNSTIYSWHGRAVNFETCCQWALTTIYIYCAEVPLSFCNHVNDNFLNACEWTGANWSTKRKFLITSPKISYSYTYQRWKFTTPTGNQTLWDWGDGVAQLVV